MCLNVWLRLEEMLWCALAATLLLSARTAVATDVIYILLINLKLILLLTQGSMERLKGKISMFYLLVCLNDLKSVVWFSNMLCYFMCVRAKQYDPQMTEMNEWNECRGLCLIPCFVPVLFWSSRRVFLCCPSSDDLVCLTCVWALSLGLLSYI